MSIYLCSIFDKQNLSFESLNCKTICIRITLLRIKTHANICFDVDKKQVKTKVETFFALRTLHHHSKMPKQ